MSQHTIETSRGVLTYTLHRKQVKNINLRVRIEGTVSLSANPRVSLSTIEDFILRKADFIFDALENFQEKAPLDAPIPVSRTGDSVLYLGGELVIAVVEGKAKIPWNREGTLFVVTENVQDSAKIQRQVDKFFQQRSQELFASLMVKYQSLLDPYGIPLATLKIRSMTSRWGTCHTGKGVVTLNSKLIHVPISCIDYVVLHEFCHFVHPNHSKAFYNLVSQFMPDWKTEKKQLEKYSCRI